MNHNNMILPMDTIVNQVKRCLHHHSPNGIVIVTIIEVDLLLRMHASNNLPTRVSYS